MAKNRKNQAAAIRFAPALKASFLCLLIGGSAVIPGMDEIVATRTQVNTLVANPFASMAVNPRIQLKKLVSDAPSLMIACGLAMRRFDT